MTTKVSEDKAKYFKEYRENNREKLNIYDKTFYWKKKFKCSDEFIAQYGLATGDICKMKQIMIKLKNEFPDLIPQIMEEINKP